MEDQFAQFRSLLNHAEFAKDVSVKLTPFRRNSETDEQTLDRILNVAKKHLCPECGGLGYNSIGRTCVSCYGVGEKPQQKPNNYLYGQLHSVGYMDGLNGYNPANSTQAYMDGYDFGYKLYLRDKNGQYQTSNSC